MRAGGGGIIGGFTTAKGGERIIALLFFSFFMSRNEKNQFYLPFVFVELTSLWLFVFVVLRG